MSTILYFYIGLHEFDLITWFQQLYYGPIEYVLSIYYLIPANYPIFYSTRV